MSDLTLWFRRLGTVFAVTVVVACSPSAQEKGVRTEQHESMRGHEADVEAWRAKRDEGLRRDDGWLSLVGLHWLDEGENSFGSGENQEIKLPAGKIAEQAGVLRRNGAKVTFVPSSGVEFTVAGKPVESPLDLVSDLHEGTTTVEHGSLLFYVIERGDLVGIRVKDRKAELLETFEGMDSFPIDPSWRLEGRYTSYDEPQTMMIPNVLGTASEAEILGEIEFEHEGAKFVLKGTGNPEESFFLVFGDKTNGHGTYGGGRFLYTEAVTEDGTVVADFNKAYNPPCVFTPYATCPLPPADNRLTFGVGAGEKSFRGH